MNAHTVNELKGGTLRVIVLGAGAMGRSIVELVGTKPAIDLVGVFDRPRSGAAASPTGPLPKFGLEHDLQALLRRTRPTVAVQATCSRFADALGEVQTLLAQGVNVVSIAEEMAYPSYSFPDQALALHRLATSNRVTLLGTGINPGFVLDLLVIVLSGVCQQVDSITATRVNDLSPYGPSVLNAQGVGLSPEAFAAGLHDATVSGHHGFDASLAMIADALGWTIERIEQSIEPIISQVRRCTPHITVEPGQVAGCRHEATAFIAGRPAIRLIHPQQIHPQLASIQTFDEIDIRGRPNVHLCGRPEIPGGLATAALAVNAIPRVVAAPPGLLSMADIPPPAAMLGPRTRNRRAARHTDALIRPRQAALGEPLPDRRG